jgi:hypothetical protein
MENPDYFAVVRCKFFGNFYDGSFFADAKVLEADPAGPLKEEYTFREKRESNTVDRFDSGHEFVVFSGENFVHRSSVLCESTETQQFRS